MMTKNEIILTLLYSNHSTPIVGTTRLQKLLFLVEKEKGLEAEKESFNFEAFKFGPVSKALYDDIEFLVNIGFLEKSGEDSRISEFSLDEIDKIKVEDLLEVTSDLISIDEGDDMEERTANDDMIVYRVTEKGVNYLKENNLIESEESKKIEDIKKRYAKKSLNELLKYIYIKYPDYATESEIRDQVL